MTIKLGFATFCYFWTKWGFILFVIFYLILYIKFYLSFYLISFHQVIPKFSVGKCRNIFLISGYSPVFRSHKTPLHLKYCILCNNPVGYSDCSQGIPFTPLRLQSSNYYQLEWIEIQVTCERFSYLLGLLCYIIWHKIHRLSCENKMDNILKECQRICLIWNLNNRMYQIGFLLRMKHS